jgi:transposase
MAMDAGIQLTNSEREQLRRFLRGSAERGAAMRATAVLLSGNGMNCQEVAAILGMTDREVRKCRQRWREDGVSGMHEAPRSGRPALADAGFIRLLVRTAKKDPRKMGYAFSRWTTPRLSTFLAQKTGVKLSPHYLSTLLRMHGYTWGKAKRTTRNLADPKEKKTRREMAQEAAKRLEIIALQF